MSGLSAGRHLNAVDRDRAFDFERGAWGARPDAYAAAGADQELVGSRGLERSTGAVVPHEAPVVIRGRSDACPRRSSCRSHDSVLRRE